MKSKELAKRYGLFIISLWFSALGVAITKCGSLGVSCISSVPNVLSLRFTALTIGGWTFLWNTLLVVCQIARQDVPEALGKLRVIYPNIMKLTYDNTRTRTNRVIDGAENVKRKSELELFEELYQQQNNQPMSDQQRSYVRELIESIKEANP